MIKFNEKVQDTEDILKRASKVKDKMIPSLPSNDSVVGDIFYNLIRNVVDSNRIDFTKKVNESKLLEVIEQLSGLQYLGKYQISSSFITSFLRGSKQILELYPKLPNPLTSSDYLEYFQKHQREYFCTYAFTFFKQYII